MNSEVQAQKGFISTNMWDSPYFPSFLFFHLYIQLLKFWNVKLFHIKWKN